MALLISLCQNAALLAIGVVAYSFARPTLASWRKLPQAVTSGTIFAGLTLLSMLAPLYVGTAVMLDIRGTLIALAALFAGPLAAAMAAVPAAIYRLEVSGPTTVPAMVALLTAVGFGWGLRAWTARRGTPVTIVQLAGLGVAQALAVAVANLTLDDAAVRHMYLSEFALPLAVLTVIGSIGFGSMILDADRRRTLQRLIGERDDRLRRNQEVVFRILRDELAAGRSLADQLRAITRITADALDVDWVSVWLYDDTQKQAACMERWDAMVGRHAGAPDLWFDEPPDLRETLAKTLTYRVSDMRADPIADAFRRRHQPGAEPTSALFTAIRRGDRLIGHVAVATVERRRDWRIDDDTVIRSLADLVGIALLRDEVERKERRLRRNQELLVGIVRDELLRTAPLDEVLRSMTETIGEALEIERTSVWLADPATGRHRCHDVWDKARRQHLATGALSMIRESPVLYEEFTRTLAIVVNDIETDRRLSETHRQSLTSRSIKSLLIAAIGSAGEPLGYMSFAATTKPRAWTIEDQTLARSLADLVGLAVLKDQLDKKEQALRRNQTLVMQIVRDELLRAAPLTEILASITAIIGRALEIDRVSLWELAPTDGAFHCRARWDGPSQRQMPSDPVPIPAALSLFDGVKQDIVVSIVDFATDPRVTPLLREKLGHDLPRSALLALIGTPDEPIGILGFASFENRRVWALEEQTLARSLAHLIAFALISHSYREAIAALDLVGEGIYVQGPTAEVIYANRAARDLGLLDGTSGPALADTDMASELSWTTPHGSRHELAVSRQRLPDGGIVTMLSDITGQKERQRRHELLEDQLRQTTKMEAVGRLAGGIAHDFNNMIGAILGFASFLAEDLPANSDQQSFARRIIQVCERSRDVVKQLLAFSRPDDATKSVVDLRTAVIDNGALLKAALPPSTGLVMEVGADPLPVLANVGQIYQVLLNLCGNANDALEGKPGNIIVSLALIDGGHPDRRVFEGGGHEPDLAVATGGWIDPDRPYASIRVVDNGGGMLQATIDQIFEPFFTTKDRGHGTGLGLAVVHGIVTAYQGAYAVRSRVGSGSDFSIYLPLAELAPVERRDRAATPQGQESVLVVDDEVDLTDMLSIGLGRLGYDVTCSNDPVEALSAFEQDPGAWSIVVTDQSMPTMTGTAMIKRLKTIRPDCIAILCTGFADGSAEDVALEAGADAFLLKPVEAHGVAQTLRDLLDRRAMAADG